MLVDNAPTIGLYGIFGTYNYGTEAIVRGSEKIIHKVLPNAKIIYASHRMEDDKRRLSGCNLEIIPIEKHPLTHPSYVNSAMGYFTGIYARRLYREKLDWVNRCSVIFTIGGDIYYPNSKRVSTQYNFLVHFGENIKNMGKKLVPWGVSMGPYSNVRAKKYFVNHMRESDLVISREPQTTRYLNSCGLSNVIERPDPAFSLAKPLSELPHYAHQEKLVLGINLSPLSSRISYNSGSLDEVIRKQAKSISQLIGTFNCDVILIPHVFADFDKNDDDLAYLKMIKKNIMNDVKDHVSIIEEDVGFLGIRNILCKCDLVIASRMHCAINAMSMCIPTILLIYSNKALGMAEFVYGNNNYSIQLNDFCTPCIRDVVRSVLENKDIIKKLLETRISEVLNQDYSFLNKII
jgi:polysaccharide pyruvyl transferase WcaK-like protein